LLLAHGSLKKTRTRIPAMQIERNVHQLITHLTQPSG
jgi:hypothetical protein